MYFLQLLVISFVTMIFYLNYHLLGNHPPQKSLYFHLLHSLKVEHKNGFSTFDQDRATNGLAIVCNSELYVKYIV